MNLSVTALGRRFGLSRSALLYYDRIGLLSPSHRSAAGYRLYGERDAKRLEAICRYRDLGLRLDQIRELLEGSTGRTATLLEARLEELDGEIQRLREQQRVIVRLLTNRTKLRRTRAMDKPAWVALLRASGLDDAAMHRWHVEFERTRPEAHQDFLESLGLPPAEVTRIRKASRPKDERKIQNPI